MGWPIAWEEDERKGRFYIEENGKRLAEMVYNKVGTRQLIIEHTEVSDTLEGQGAGQEKPWWKRV